MKKRYWPLSALICPPNSFFWANFNLLVRWWHFRGAGDRRRRDRGRQRQGARDV